MSDDTRPLTFFVEKVAGGGTPSRNISVYWSGPIPWASVKDLKESSMILTDTKEHISAVGLANSAATLVPAGTPIVCTRMAVGRCVISTTDVAINQDLKALFPNSATDARYLAHGLTYLRASLDSVATGSTVKGISVSQLLSFKLYRPPVSVQRKIADLLDAADEAISSTEQLIAKLEQGKQGLLLDLLTRGVDENGHLRDSEKLLESPVGLVPPSWSAGPLRSYLVLQRGFDITVAEQRPGNIPVVSSSGISSFHDRAMVKGPGVVIGRKGKLGDAYYIATDFWPHDTSLWVKQFKNVVPEFAAVLLKSMRLERFDAATSVPTLNRNFIHPIPIVVPPAEEQIQILKTLDAASCRIRREKENLAKLRLVKRGLMDDLLTGQVQVGAST